METETIQIRLYGTSDDEVKVINWLRTLPCTPTGRRRIKENVIPILVEAIGKNGQSNGSAEPAPRKRARQKRSAGDGETRQPQETPREDESHMNGNGIAEAANGELPDFPPVDNIEF